MATTAQTSQNPLWEFSSAQNNIADADRVAHDWYRFVLSFPPHLVRRYLERFSICRGNTVLDPFCGTGTTVVECKKLGINSLGVEAHPMAAFASRVKLDWTAERSL
jgi:tRNA G10  N-methylase Trm11